MNDYLTTPILDSAGELSSACCVNGHSVEYLAVVNGELGCPVCNGKLVH